MKHPTVLLLTAVWALTLAACAGDPRPDPLPSWREGPTRERIESFIWTTRAFATDAPHLSDHERIAVFDHDGLLIAEHPIYLQYAFVIDMVIDRAPDHPEWSADPILSVALARDYDAVLSTRGSLARLTTAAGKRGLRMHPSGARTSTGRYIPSLFGRPGRRAHRIA